jgi:hypothetical protein
MLLLPNNKFNQKLYTGAWMHNSGSLQQTPLLVTACGYPAGEDNRDNGFPLMEMSQALFPDQETLVSEVERLREEGVLRYTGI